MVIIFVLTALVNLMTSIFKFTTKHPFIALFATLALCVLVMIQVVGG